MNAFEELSANELDALALSIDEQQGEAMFNDVCHFLSRFIHHPSDNALVAHALWIIHTHLMDLWDTTPRIAFLSAEPGSGKSRALEVTELLVPNSVQAVNVSPSYLFRKVGEDDGATILFDEIDTVFGPKAKENEELRGLLNAGHRRGAVAGRCVVRGKNIETEELPAYSAVALAGLGFLPDTIMTRSILVKMRKRKNGEAVEQFRRRVVEPQGRAVREKIISWCAAAKHKIKLSATEPQMPEGVQDRDADNWEALLAIAEAIGETVAHNARLVAAAMVAESRDRETSLGVRLLSDIRTIFTTEPWKNEFSSKSLLAALHEIPEAPWSSLQGKPLDDRGLARRLRHYDIKPKTIRVGHETPRGYSREDFSDAWERYLAPGDA